jgi:hypothetical protein
MRRNNPYFGYVPPDNTLDWAKLTGGLVDTITGISEERAKQKEELDQININNQRIVSTVDSYSDQTLNGFVGSAAVEARSVLSEWTRQLKNREITAAEYKSRNNNLMTNWSAVGTTAKTFNATIQEALKRQQPDENGNVVASGEELYKIGKLAEFGDLKNKKVFIDPQTGNLMTGVLDPSTGQVDPSTLVTGVAMNNVENIQTNKVNLNQLVANDVKNWGDFLDDEGLTAISGKGLNPKIAKAKASFIGVIMNNPSSIASVLDDNTSYDIGYYSGNSERNALINNMLKLENETRRDMDQDPMTDEESQKYVDENSWMMIQMARDGNGVMRPVLTQEQTEKAREVIMDQIDIQLGQKITKDPPTKDSGSTGDKLTDAQISAQKKGFEIQQIMSSGEDSKTISNKLRIASGGQYYFKKEKNNTWSVYDGKPHELGFKDAKYTGIKTSADMYRIFSTRDQEQYYKQGTKSKSKTKTKTTFD